MIEKRASGLFRARIYHKGKEVASRSFGRKRDAEAWERSQKAALSAGTWVAPADVGVTLAAWAQTWGESQPKRKPSTEHTAEGLWRNHILKSFGRRPIVTISHTEVGVWAQALSSQSSPSTARAALGYMRRCLDAAVHAGLISRNPAVGIRLPKTQANEPNPLTHEQVWRLADELPPRDRVLVLVGAYGGLRWGELAALRVKDVTAKGVRLRVRESASTTTGKVVVGPVKTHQARSVPLPASVATEVVAWIKSQALNPPDLLFPSAVGTHLQNGNWRSRVLDPAIKRSGTPYITPHNLRDTAASLAIASGASVVTVARLLGHESSATTLRHYAGMFPDDLDRVATGLDRGAKRAKNTASKRLAKTQ